MADYIRPNTKKQLRAFLGSVSFYRKFIEGFAELSSHLTPAVSSKAPRGVEWTPALVSCANHFVTVLFSISHPEPTTLSSHGCI